MEVNVMKGFRLDQFIKEDMKVKVKARGVEVLLNLKDVAIGLNISFVANSGNDVVRWNRVKEYLTDIDPNITIPEGQDNDLDMLYIPEWVFYMLCMKARNDKAKRFQLWIAQEILPNVRKFGAYISPDLLDQFYFSQEELATGHHPIELVMRQALQSREKVIEYRDKYYDAQDKMNEAKSDLSSMKQMALAMWRTALKIYVTEGHYDPMLLSDLSSLGDIVKEKYPEISAIFEEIGHIEK